MRRCLWAMLVAVLLVPVSALAKQQPKQQPKSTSTSTSTLTARAEHSLERLWKRIMAELEAASVSLEPTLVPPKSVKLAWATRRIAALDLKAPVLAVTVADIDGDDKTAELIALTTREVVVLKLIVRTYRRGGRRITRRRWHVAGTFPLPPTRAAIGPRDPVGALLVANVDNDDEPEILARSSTLSKGVVLEWKGGRLVELSRFDGFPVCANVRARLSSGRNYFLSSRISWPADTNRPVMPKRFYSARCVSKLVDAKGRMLTAFGRVATNGVLSVSYVIECGRRDSACKASPASEVTVKGVGTAWAIADVDNDGVPEVITSGTKAPGLPDRVTVYAGATKLARKYRRRFVGGIVGIASGDIDGDGDRDVVAVVRMLGATMVEVWSLNR